MHRRKFLRQAALVSCSPFMPGFLRQTVGSRLGSETGKIVIVVQLSGGNDGLNTVIPYGDDVYYRERPELGIKGSGLISMNDHLGFNHILRPLMDSYESGEMAILNAVGYPNPNRSHFRSMDIWQTGAGHDEYLQSGWVGRYLDSECAGCNQPYQAIEIGDHLSPALQGVSRKGFAMRGLNKLKRTTSNQFLKELGQTYQHTNQPHDELDYLYKTMVEVQESASYILDKATGTQARASYPDHAFGKGLKQIAELIMADSDTKVYYISLPGFDTHVNQLARQEQLLGIYAQGVAALIRDLKENHLFEESLILTFSEFGRRVKENASGGTDHGAANSIFMMGGALKKPGIYNDFPDLSDLVDGDVPYQIDFRSIYANILEDWLQADASKVLSPGDITRTTVI